MSLLMKALEKAAKDRGEARADGADAPATLPGTAADAPETLPGKSMVEPETLPGKSAAAPETLPGGSARAAAAPSPASDLSLEPISFEAQAPTPALAPRPEPQIRQPASPRSAPAAAPAREQQARASTVVRAAAPARGGGAGEYVLKHPLAVVIVIAILIAVAYGAYVYLQIFHPALFLPQRPQAPRPPVSPLAQATAPTPVPAPGPAAAPTPAPATQGPAPSAAGEPPTAPGAPVSTAAVVQPPVPNFAAPKAPATSPRETEKPTPAAPAPARAPRDTIVVSRVTGTPAVNPLLDAAYTALREGRSAQARSLYDRLIQSEPRNIDALLGLAAVAGLEGKGEDAARRYMQVLELEPRNALAQSGLIGLNGRADPIAAESRLKQLIDREPSAYLYFTLGNLYADREQWAAAQHAYFQAHHLEPGNADYAYNLAVGLEHVRQTRLALGFYRRALELADAGGGARFDPARARERINSLVTQVE